MRIALIVDNPYRDLPGIVLLATRLAQSNATCYLVPLNLASLELSALAPDFVLLPSLRKPRQRFASQLLDAGMRIGVLDAEGGVMPSLEMYSKLTTPDRSLYEDVSCFCSWGPKLANFVKSDGWYNENQVVVTGSPRFDFYAPQWRDAALKISPETDQYKKPIILINGSFPRANPVMRTPEKELVSWMGLGFERDFVEQRQNIERQSMLGMIELANHVALRFPEASVVYRPHPFEKLETYRDLLKPLDNLHLLKSGTVEGWILRASVIIQHHCTTAIEAGMAGKVALLPDWLPIAQRIDSTESVSIKCSSQSDMDDRLVEILYGKANTADAVRDSLNDVLATWFYAIDGRAHERAADTILTALNNGNHGPINLSKCRKIHYQWGQPDRSGRVRLGSAVRLGLRLPVSWSISKLGDVKTFNQSWDQSIKRFDANMVSNLVRAIGPFESPIQAVPAQEKRDYRLGYTIGRSVVLSSSLKTQN